MVHRVRHRYVRRLIRGMPGANGAYHPLAACRTPRAAECWARTALAPISPYARSDRTSRRRGGTSQSRQESPGTRKEFVKISSYSKTHACNGRVRDSLPAAVALPALFVVSLLFAAFVVAVGGLPADAVTAGEAGIVGWFSFRSQPATAPLLGLLGWFFAASFSAQPFAAIHLSQAPAAAVVLGVVTSTASAAGAVRRRSASRATTNGSADSADGDAGILDDVAMARSAGTRRRPHALASLSWRRQVLGLLTSAVLLPIATVLLTTTARHALADVALGYLLVVFVVTMIGGVWVAIAASLSAGLLINWYFSPPVHTWTIDAPENIASILLFVAVALSVSFLVHLSARRAQLAEARRREADLLLALAERLLGGDDSPQAVLDELAKETGSPVVLEERCGGTWVTVAKAGSAAGSNDPQHAAILPAGATLRLVVGVSAESPPDRLLRAYAAQAAAALERQRLRIQASQAEALAAGNRMRTALLAAVSHDLRTPLASIKAGVSTLRQTDIQWSPSDVAELLSSVDQATDQLDALIANLLDMSRIHTGAVQPFLRPTALEEVAPLALAGLADAERVQLDIPEDLPLIATDPGLLERVLANLVANALRHSPPHLPPAVVARIRGEKVRIDVVDHGPGIPPHARDRVFQPFQQLDDRRGGGVGLGLAVARGFVEALGGEIHVLETPGGGVTMRVELPISAYVPSDIDA